MPKSAMRAITTLAFATLTGFVMISGAMATNAHADTDTITIASAGSPASAVGDLTVVADSTTPITSLNVHLLDTASTDVMDPAMTMSSQTITATGFESTWTVAAPIAEGTAPDGLALGDYTISVDATDAGTSVSNLNAGTLAFKDEPAITVAADPTAVSYDNKTATISGQVTILAPDGTTTPDANSTVSLTSSMGPPVPLTTDANGDYSTTVTPFDGDWVVVKVDATSTLALTESREITFTLRPDPVNLTARLSAKTVTYGSKVTVSGTVTYRPGDAGSSYVPLTGAPVVVFSAQHSSAPAAKGTTDGAGKFTITLPKAADSTWLVEAGGNPYLVPVTVQLPMSVNLPTIITGFHAKLNQFGQLSFNGCLSMKEAIAGARAFPSGMTIQYSIGRPTGPWRTLTRSIQSGSGCGTHGTSFHGTAAARVNYAYYRAVSPSRNVPGIGNLLPATSAKVLAWKYADRITSFSVSPHVVARGHKLTVKGQLQYFSSRWRSFGGQQILIVLRPKGSGTWFWIVKVKTHSDGRFSATFTDPVSATWSAVYEGNSRHLAVGAPQIYVRLR